MLIMEMINLKGIYKSYKEKEVLKNINFTVNQGDVFAYIGPNGAGKTTTIKLLCGINKPNKGQAYLKSSKGFDYKVSVVFDFNGLYENMTAYENLLFFCKLSDLDKDQYEKTIDKMLDLVNLVESKDNLVKNFSKGMKRRLVLARAIIDNPNILILDEPFDGIDVENHFFVVKFLKEWVSIGERCIIFTSHNMNEVEKICNKIAIIKEGQIIKTDYIDSLVVNDSGVLKIHLADNKSFNLIKELVDGLQLTITHDNIKNSVSILKGKLLSTNKIIKLLVDNNIEFTEITEEKYSLEELYVRLVSSNIE